MSQAECNEPMAGVRHERHPRVAHQRNLRALLQRHDQLRRARHLIVFMVADQRLVNVVVSEQLHGVARVFAGDLVGFLQDSQRPKRDVFEISDRRPDKIKAAAGCRIRSLRRPGGRSLRAHAHESSAVPTILAT